MAGYDLPVRAIRQQIASALDVIVQLERMHDGSRKIVNVTEVLGMEGSVVTLQDLFLFEQAGFEDGKVIGQIKPTGIVDAETQAAIERFERERKLPVTGQPSDRVARELAAVTGRTLE